ncbi:Nramp family divalent metal transporter [Fulvivirga sp. 29W222]|uniref:Nramp family divalent metal transporter n=1 Tax=Fulvivirga marina TaxID=2494733 RepID=A0A937FZ44_9BACT|nr:Nramp family divalent metal transporter [Fulvivirga marina]MBL6447030.1 Nramp family divalent metal transporter [Fulvivirga marina]
MNDKVRNFLKTLGPGIVFAGMCIGVSHLVQSTRAGADYGFTLLIAVIAANLFKYPFFEFSSRYTGATGLSILDGYAKVGKWILWVYGIMTIVTMFIVSAAVTFVAAGLLSNLMGVELNTNWWAAIILGVCIIVLGSGRYGALDSLLKIVSIVLLISTITAVVVAFAKGRPDPVEGFIPKELNSTGGLIFLIALMGWMPTAVDMSTWTGLWAEARIKQTGYKPTLKETLLDFNIGYSITALLAVIFLSLGALVMYGSGIELSNSAPAFAGQLLGMYTSSIGPWSYFIIAVAAFSTMFSTSITVLDGYGRTMERIVKLIFDGKKKVGYIYWIALIAVGAFLVISQFLNDLKSLVDLATIVSFVIAPLAAFLNYKVIFSKDITGDFVPPKWLKLLAMAGLVFLSAFTLIYFYVLI